MLLIDELYRMTFGKPVEGWVSNRLMRQVLTSAQRFVLNDAMSAFLADLVFSVIQKKTETTSLRSLNFARQAARLPYDVTWVEFDVPQFDAREIALGGSRCFYEPPDDEQHLREGWLLNGFQQAEQEFRAHYFRAIVKNGQPTVWACPLTINWTTKDKAVSFFTPDQTFLADVAVGCLGWGEQFPYARIAAMSELLQRPPELVAAMAGSELTAKMLAPYAGPLTGILHRIWTFLATVNDLPVELRASAVGRRGFHAKAQPRRFLEHTVVTLKIPRSTNPGKLARSTVAAAKRRAHSVRGHFRKDFRHPGEHIWIREHQRGDAALGLVQHDYKVVH